MFYFKCLVIVLSCFSLSCNKNNLPDFNKLEGVRVLALQANTPEVNPSTTVTITPIISDLQALTLKYSAYACTDPGVSYGAKPTCQNSLSKVIIASDVALSLPGSTENWTGSADTFTVNIPDQATLFTGRSNSEKMNGVVYLIEYILTNNSGQSVTAFKRILVSDSSKTSKNSNPSISTVYADGQVMSSLPLSTQINLSTDLSLNSAESYTLISEQNAAVTETETLTTTWFVTDGETKYYRSIGIQSNLFTTPTSAPAGRSFYLLAVVHDNRGGVAFVKKKF